MANDIQININETYDCNKLNKYTGINIALEQLAKKIDRINKINYTNTIDFSHLVDKINNCLDYKFASTYERLLDINKNIEKIISIEQINLDRLNLALKNLGNTVLLFNECIDRKYFDLLLSKLEHIDLSCLDNIDLEEIEIQEDYSISYKGETVFIEDFDNELEKQVIEATKSNDSPKNPIENFNKNHWLLIFILNLLIVIVPSLPQTIGFYSEAYETISCIINDDTPVCYTIKEKSFIRESAESKSKKLISVTYDTELTILEDIPRWYKVIYITDENEEIVGWISKISVELE